MCSAGLEETYFPLNLKLKGYFWHHPTLETTKRYSILPSPTIKISLLFSLSLFALHLPTSHHHPPNHIPSTSHTSPFHSASHLSADSLAWSPLLRYQWATAGGLSFFPLSFPLISTLLSSSPFWTRKARLPSLYVVLNRTFGLHWNQSGVPCIS